MNRKEKRKEKTLIRKEVGQPGKKEGQRSDRNRERKEGWRQG